MMPWQIRVMLSMHDASLYVSALPTAGAAPPIRSALPGVRCHRDDPWLRVATHRFAQSREDCHG